MACVACGEDAELRCRECGELYCTAACHRARWPLEAPAAVKRRRGGAAEEEEDDDDASDAESDEEAKRRGARRGRAVGEEDPCERALERANPLPASAVEVRYDAAMGEFFYVNSLVPMAAGRLVDRYFSRSAGSARAAALEDELLEFVHAHLNGCAVAPYERDEAESDAAYEKRRRANYQRQHFLDWWAKKRAASWAPWRTNLAAVFAPAATAALCQVFRRADMAADEVLLVDFVVTNSPLDAPKKSQYRAAEPFDELIDSAPTRLRVLLNMKAYMLRAYAGLRVRERYLVRLPRDAAKAPLEYAVAAAEREPYTMLVSQAAEMRIFVDASLAASPQPESE